MTDYQKLLIYIRRSISNGVLLGQGKVKLCFSLKNKSEGFVLTLLDTFYLLNSFCNLISLAYLNNSGIFHNNEDKNF